jgi:hypothetical protein
MRPPRHSLNEVAPSDDSADRDCHSVECHSVGPAKTPPVMLFLHLRNAESTIWNRVTSQRFQSGTFSNQSKNDEALCKSEVPCRWRRMPRIAVPLWLNRCWPNTPAEGSEGFARWVNRADSDASSSAAEHANHVSKQPSTFPRAHRNGRTGVPLNRRHLLAATTAAVTLATVLTDATTASTSATTGTAQQRRLRGHFVHSAGANGTVGPLIGRFARRRTSAGHGGIPSSTRACGQRGAPLADMGEGERGSSIGGPDGPRSNRLPSPVRWFDRAP